MKHRIIHYAVGLNCLFCTSFYIASALAAWSSVDGKGLFPWPIYKIHVFVLGFLVVNLILAAFLFFRHSWKKWSAFSVFLGTILGTMSSVDAYIFFFRFQTFGSGSQWNLTNLRWVQRFSHANERGYWERPLLPYEKEERKDQMLLAAVGDSFTWGMGLHGKHLRFTNVAERYLQDNFNQTATILQYGKPGADTRDEMKIIKEDVAPVKPRVVMIFYLSNDITEKPVMDWSPVTFDSWQHFCFAISPSYNYLYWRYRGPGLYASQARAYFTNLLLAYLNSDDMKKHLTDVGDMIQTVHSIGAKPVLVILPFPRMWQNVHKHIKDEIYAKIADCGRQHGARVLELQGIEEEMTPQEFEVAATDAHPNERAHALMGERIGEWLIANNDLLASPNRFSQNPDRAPVGRPLPVLPPARPRTSWSSLASEWRLQVLALAASWNLILIVIGCVRSARPRRSAARIAIARDEHSLAKKHCA
jgi:lysophospholipase L1-like esterase